jgi:hypothetical protein
MTEFDKELDNRDVFLGDRRCVICGIADPESLRHSYTVSLIAQSPGRLKRFATCGVELTYGTAYRLFSGHGSNIWDGPQRASKRRLNPAMTCFCALAIFRHFINRN